MKNFILRLFSIELLLKTMTSFLLKKLYTLSPGFRATVRKMLLRGALLLLMVHLGSMSLLLALLAVAAYLNEILESSYQGVAIVAASIAVIWLCLWPILRRMHRS